MNKSIKIKNQYTKKLYFISIVILLIISSKIVFDKLYFIGKKIDSFNNVNVYYNGNPKNISGRNLTKDGYNLGLKYQCVEFVKRYYYEHLKHKMPNSYGHAKDYFRSYIGDGKINSERDLTQYKNPSSIKPKENDLLIFRANILNKFGHVAIISKVENGKIEIIQQNVFLTTREEFRLIYNNSKWYIDDKSILGWLRK